MRTFTQKWASLLMVVLFGFCLQANAQSELTVANGTANNSYLPLYGLNADTEGMKGQCLYPADSLSEMAGGSISQMTFYCGTTIPAEAWGGTFNVYLGETNESNLSSAFISVDDLTLVYTGSLDATSGALTIEFDDAYSYQGGNLVVDVTLSLTGNWKSASFLGVTNLTGSGRYRTSGSGAGTVAAFLPEVTFTYTPGGSVGPTCDKPTDLDFTGITSTEATLNWAGGSGTYDVEYQVKGADDWTFAVKNSSATSTTLNNLVPNTSYNVRVKSKCDAGVESGYKTGSFKTLIGIPYADQLATQGDWTKRQGLVNEVMSGTALSGTGSWSFGARYGVLGGNHAYRNVWGSSCKDWIISPVIPMEENCQLSFSLALTDNGNADPIEDFTAQQDDRFIVLATTDEGATWSILREWNNTGSAFVYNQIATEGEDVEIDLSAYANANVQIAFYCESTASGGDNDIHVGNVLIDYAPSCLKPTSLHEVEGSASKNSIQIAWQHGGADAFEVQYKKASESEYGAPIEVTLTPAENVYTYTLSNLDAFTEYNVRVAAICDLTDESTLTDYCKAITIKTATGVPYAQDFNVIALPSEWKRYDSKLSSIQSGGDLVATTDGWETVAKAQANNIFDSAYHAVLNIADTTNYWLVSPTIEMEAGYQLTFDIALTKKEGGAVTAGSQPDDVFEVLVFADDEWNALGIWNNTGSATQFDAINSAANGQTVKFDLDAYAGKNIRLAFYGESTTANGDNNLHLANLSIAVKPSCSPALSLSINNLDVTTATAVWTTDEPGSVWQYGLIANPAADFAPAEADFVNDTTALSVALTGLTGETTYAFFLRKVCDNGNSDPIVRTFTTYPAPKTVPWHENFEAYDANTIAPYWDNSSSNTPSITGDGGVTINPHYVWGVYSYSDNKMIRMYNSLVQKGTAIINTPRIDLAPENGCMLSFDYTHAASCDPFSVRISTDNGVNWTELGSYAKNVSSNNTTDPGEFTKVEINLAAYAGQVVMLQFYSVSNYGSGAIFVDNVAIDQLPDCLKPTNLAVSAVSAHGATFSWDNEDGATWEYVCVPDSITELPAYTPCAQNSLQLETLDERTDYIFYLRRVCGENSVSDSIFVTFSTPCAAYSIANNGGLYLEDFEDYEGVAYNAHGIAPDCWTVGGTATYKPHVIGSGSYYYKHSGTKALTFYGSGYCYAAMPEFAEELNTLQIKFWMQTENASNGILTLGYITDQDPGDFSTFQAIQTFPNSSGSMSQREKILDDIDAEAYRLAFRWYYSTQYSCCIDDIEVSPIPTCLKPSDLTVVDSLTTTTSVTFTWTPGLDETYYLVQYKKSTDSIWAYVPDTVHLADTTFTLTGLEPSSTYEVRFASWCNTIDSTDISEFTAPFSFITNCDVITTFPYSENFDALAAGTSGATNLLPICWDHINTTTYSSYMGYPTAYKGTSYANTPDNSLKFYSYSYQSTSTNYDPQDQYAILPEMQGINNLRIKFNARKYSASYDATFTVGVMTNPADTATYVVIDTIRPAGIAYESFVVPFSAASADARFIVIKMDGVETPASGSAYRGVHIDDIVVEIIPNCLEPVDLVVLDTTITLNSAEFTWTKQGDETAWALQYKKHADAEWTTVAALTDTFKLEGLTSATMYDVRVAAQCSETETSPYTNVVTFVTACGAWSIAEQGNYTEGFEAYDGTACGTNGVVPVCWDAVSSGSVAPHVINPGDTYAYVHGGEKALTFYGSGYCYAVLPEFAEQLNTLRISFWSGMESLSYGTLTLGYITNESSIFHPIEEYESSLKSAMAQHITDLTAVPDSAARLVFQWYYSGQWSCCIDDIEVSFLPNCLEPKGLDVVLTRGNGSVATLNWNDTIASAWVVEYSLHADMSDAISVAANDTTIELTGLLADSTYYARVKTICGENEESAWTNAISFVPTSAITINDGTTTSSYVPFYGSGVNNATQSQFIIPEKEIELIKWDSITQLTFYSSSTYKNQSWTGSKFEVYVAETSDTVLTAMLDWADMTKVMNAKHLELVDQQMVVTLDKPFQYQGGNIVIGFKLTTTGSTGYCYWYGKSGVSGNAIYKYNTSAATKSNFNPKMTIAHVQGVVPTCLVVKNVEASEITASSAKLSWTNGEESQNAWQIAYSCDPAFDLASVTAEQIADAASNPFVLTGLLPDTLYNVYVRANCSEDENEDYSLWSKLYTFRTAKSCQTPDDLAAADVSHNSASISWNTYGQTGFNLRYINGTDTVLAENVESPYVLNGLTANEHYYVQVQNDCNVEEWSESVHFKTLCVAWSIAVDGDYVEDFESYTGTAYNAAGVAPDCWEVGGTSNNVPHVVNGTSYAWTHSGVNSFSLSGTANSYCYGVLPQFAEDLNRLQISLWTRMESTSYGTLSLGYITEAEDMIYVLKNYPNLTTMTNYVDALDTIPAEATRLVLLWQYSGTSYYSCTVDDIEVSFIPTCIKPEAVTATEVAGHSAKISWTLGEAGQTAWQIAYDTLPSKQPDTLTIVNAVDSVYQLTGLNPQTKYYVYVRANCGEQDGMSKWSDGIYFTTTVACPAPSGLKATLTPGNGSIATLSWVAGDAQAWQVEYSLNSNMSDSLVLNVTEATANLTGLTAEATYYARVKADCGELDGESVYSAIISFVPTNKYEMLINSGTATNNYVPVEGNYVDEGTASQFVIPAASIENLEWDSIKVLTFYTSATSSNWGASEWEIYMTELSEATLSAQNDWNEMTKVMNSAALAVVNGKMVVTLDSAYQYQGGNLLIGFKQTVVSGGAYGSVSWSGVTATGASIGGHGTGTSMAQRNFLPKLNIEYVPGVAPACPNPKYLTISEVTDSSAVASWKAVADAAWEYALVEGTAEPALFTEIAENSIELNNLKDATLYTFYLRRACGEAGTSELVSAEFTTDAHIEAVPLYEDFEGASAWKFINGTEANAWVIGTAVARTGDKALYISNNGGSTNAYETEQASATFATILLNFNRPGTFTFSYDWKADGDYSVEDEEVYDYLRVALVPAAAVLTAGTPALPEGYIALDGGGLYGATEWQHKVADDVEVIPGHYKLVFAWFNDDLDGNQAPAAIDNIVIRHKDYPTDIEGNAGFENKAVKFIYNNQVYILINGAVYNITGQKVELK